MHVNYVDFTFARGNDAGPLFVMEQKFPALKGSMLGKV
jgi:hypothetical protein